MTSKKNDPVIEAPATLVRLKPYNPKRGHLMLKYTHAPTKMRFEASAGWYEVDPDLARYLQTVKQVTGDVDSADAFDVVTREEARAIDLRERKEREKRADADAPVDLTTTDLRKGTAPAAEALTPADERRQARAKRNDESWDVAKKEVERQKERHARVMS